MNFKTTFILFGVLLALLAVFGVAQLVGYRPATDKSNYALPSLNDRKNPTRETDVETVEVVRKRPDEKTLVFYKNDAGWQLKQPAVRVEGYLVDRLVGQVLRAKSEEKADVPATLSAAGLEEPAATVTLTKKGGDKEYKLHLGNDSPGGESAVVYVSSTDRNKPMAVKKGDLDMVAKGVNDFRAKGLLEASSFNAQAVSLQEAGKDALSLEKGSDGKLRFVKPAYGEAEGEPPQTSPMTPPKTDKDINSVRELVDALGQIRVEETSDFVAEDVSDADLAAKYGLEAAKPATLRVEAKRNAGGALGADDKKGPVTEVLLIGKKVETKEAKPGGDKYYARLESDHAVVQVPARLVEPLLKVVRAPEALRNRDLIQIEVARVDAVDVTNPTGSLRLRHGGPADPWRLYVDGTAPRQADGRAVTDLLNALNAKRQVRGFPDASKKDEELGLDKPTAQVAIWVDGVQPPEKKEDKPDEKKPEEKKPDEKKPEAKKDGKPEEKKPEPKKDEPKKEESAEPKLKSDKPTVRLAFGKKEGDLVYVRREVGDDKARMAVPESLLTPVLQGPLAYLDRSLPTFPFDAEPVKLTLVRGGETFEIDREKKEEKAPATWKLSQPKTLAGRLADAMAVENILANVRNLQAERLVAEKATDADLDRFGLKSPPLKATVALKTKDGKTEDRVFLFGKETEDKAGRYAKLGERDLVFVVRPHVTTPMEGQLLDPTVLAFDAEKVRGLKLHGWNDPVRGPFTLELDRKSPATWATKVPPTFPVNEAASEAFLGTLRGLRAVKFVGQKGATKPEHKLDVKDGALEIELTLEGEKDPVKLTVGGPSAADKGYFATTNKLPGDVFVVPEGPFKKVLEGPIHFRRGDMPK